MLLSPCCRFRLLLLLLLLSLSLFVRHLTRLSVECCNTSLRGCVLCRSLCLSGLHGSKFSTKADVPKGRAAHLQSRGPHLVPHRFLARHTNLIIPLTRQTQSTDIHHIHAHLPHTRVLVLLLLLLLGRRVGELRDTLHLNNRDPRHRYTGTSFDLRMLLNRHRSRHGFLSTEDTTQRPRGRRLHMPGNEGTTRARA